MLTSTAKYNEIMEKMDVCFDEYNRKNFDNNKFSLSLANGDYLTVRVPKNSIAHLLGVNIDYLRSKGTVRMNTSAYDALTKILEERFQIGQSIWRENLKQESIF